MVKLLYVIGLLNMLSMPMLANEVLKVEQEYSKHQFAVVEGKLTAEAKEPVDYATVYLKGTQYGCISDEKGIFRLEVPARR